MASSSEPTIPSVSQIGRELRLISSSLDGIDRDLDLLPADYQLSEPSIEHLVDQIDNLVVLLGRVQASIRAHS